MVEDGAFSHKIDYLFYGNFDDWLGFAYWCSFSGGGSAINRATPSSFLMFRCKRGQNLVHSHNILPATTHQHAQHWLPSLSLEVGSHSQYPIIGTRFAFISLSVCP